MPKIYRVKLTNEERQELNNLLSKGRAAARKQTRSRILLLSDENSADSQKKDLDIVSVLGVSVRSVERVGHRFVEEGFEHALNEKLKSVYRPKKLDGAAEVFLVATACSSAHFCRE